LSTCCLKLLPGTIGCVLYIFSPQQIKKKGQQEENMAAAQESEPRPKRAKQAPALSKILDIERFCDTRPEMRSGDKIFFVPTEFQHWNGRGGNTFDIDYADRYQSGKPVSVCTHYLNFLLSRHDTPKWLNKHSLGFIDLRHDEQGTLYFFRAPKEVAEYTRRKLQQDAHQAFQLVPGRQFPPELFDVVTGNFDFKEVDLARAAGRSTAELPLPVHLCDTININFDIYEGCQLQFRQAFEKTLPLIETLLKECTRNGADGIRRVVINYNLPLSEYADLSPFFRLVSGYGRLLQLDPRTEPLMRDLLAHTKELSFPALTLSANSLNGLQFLLRNYPQLKIVIERLKLTRSHEVHLRVLPLSKPLADRVFIKTVEAEARVDHNLANMLTSHHPLNFLVREDEEEADEEEADQEEADADIPHFYSDDEMADDMANMHRQIEERRQSEEMANRVRQSEERASEERANRLRQERDEMANRLKQRRSVQDSDDDGEEDKDSEDDEEEEDVPIRIWG
jgi:hypothetical protein